MSALANHAFVKMNGLGNEIVVVDMRRNPDAISAADARAVAGPDGAPYDQMMALYPPRTGGTESFVRIFNNDGSEAGACGNGMRCVAQIVAGETGRTRLVFETAAGLLDCWKQDGAPEFTVDMGPPRFDWNEIPLAHAVADTRSIALSRGPLRAPSVVSMGNPHAVFFVEDEPDTYDLAMLGPSLEHDPIFPDRANITVARVRGRDRIAMRTWERGAGLTRACGSAACATAVAAMRLGKTDRKVVTTLPGGDLAIEWRESDGHVLMTGPAEYEYAGRFDPKLFSA